MRFRYIIFVSLLLISMVGKSQVMWILIFGDKLSNDRIQSGINISMAATNYTGLEKTKYLSSWALGGFTDIQLKKHWSLQPEFVFKSPTGASNLNEYFSFDNPHDSTLRDTKVYIETVNFSLPIYIKYETKFFGIAVGPQFSLAYSNNLILRGKIGDDTEIKLKRKIGDDMNIFDFGIASALEFYLSPSKKQTSMRLSLKYYYGFLEVMSTYSDVHNSVFLVSFGIPVVSKKEFVEDNQ